MDRDKDCVLLSLTLVWKGIESVCIFLWGWGAVLKVRGGWFGKTARLGESQSLAFYYVIRPVALALVQSIKCEI